MAGDYTEARTPITAEKFHPLVTAVRALESEPRRRMPQEPVPFVELFYGLPTAAYNSNVASITVNPTDINGNDNGIADRTVYVQPSKAAYNPSRFLIADADTDGGTEVSTTTIVCYTRSGAGDWIMLGTPQQKMVDFWVDGDNLMIKGKFQHVWANFASTISDWLTIHTGTDCADATSNALTLEWMDL